MSINQLHIKDLQFEKIQKGDSFVCLCNKFIVKKTIQSLYNCKV